LKRRSIIRAPSSISSARQFSGGAPKIVAHDVDSDLTFSPDGKRIAYIRANDPEPGKYRLLTANDDGGDETILRISQSTRGGDPQHISWSPDGKQIAYSFQSSGEALSYIENFDLGRKQVATLAALPNEQLFEVKWLPSGHSLLSVFGAKGPNYERSQIGVVSDKGVMQPVTRDTNRYSTLTVSADGKSASSVQLKTTHALTILDGSVSAKSTPEPQSLSQVTDPRELDWTLDEKLLVADAASITRMDPDGHNAAALIADPNAFILGFSSCASRYLLLAWWFHTGSTKITIWRASADGAAPKQLTTGGFDTNPVCSPDGKWAYYIDRPGTSRLMRVPVDGGTAEPVPGTAVPDQFGIEAISFVSADGKSLGYVVDVADPVTHDARASFAIAGLDGASRPRLLELDPRFAGSQVLAPSTQLVPNANALAYKISENGADNLWIQPLDGSPGHQLTHFPSERITDFHWSPDGKSLAVVREHDVADVVLLREGNQ
jgi:Tol biopolymer transport system component